MRQLSPFFFAEFGDVYRIVADFADEVEQTFAKRIELTIEESEALAATNV